MQFIDIKLLKKDEILEDMYSDMYDIYVVSWNKLYAKELFLNLRFPLGKVNEDEFLAHELIYRSKKIIFVNKILYYIITCKELTVLCLQALMKKDWIY